MALGEWLDRVGTNLGNNIGNAPPEAWFSLAQALSGTKNVGTGLAQGLAGFGQATQADRKKQTLADALKGATGGYSPEQQQFLGALEPDQAAQIIGQNLFPKGPTEKWTDLGDGRQQNARTGEIKDTPRSLKDEMRLRAAGRSNVTVNNIPAEVGARIGLGEGFLERFDDIKATAKKFYSGGPVDQVKRRGQMFFNTGEGGKLWRDVETGKEALVRNLTGQGMAVSEAQQQASRYSLSPLDTDYDALTKLDGLRRDLENTAKGVFKGRGGKYTPPKSGGDFSDVDEILGIK